MKRIILTVATLALLVVNESVQAQYLYYYSEPWVVEECFAPEFYHVERQCPSMLDCSNVECGPAAKDGEFNCESGNWIREYDEFGNLYWRWIQYNRTRIYRSSRDEDVATIRAQIEDLERRLTDLEMSSSNESHH